jgi:hypothetical protein
MLAGVMALRGLSVAFRGLVVLAVMHAGLQAIGIVILFVWGLLLVITAQPVHPVPIKGFVSNAVQISDGGGYVRTDFSLENDQRTYSTDGPALAPPISRVQPAAGDLVTVWINPGIDWFDISRTEILAISIAPESQAKATHVDWAFTHPNDRAVRQRLIGLGVLGTVGLILGLGALWEWFTERGSGGRRPPSLEAHDWHSHRHRRLAGGPKMKAMAGSIGQVWQLRYPNSLLRPGALSSDS